MFAVKLSLVKIMIFSLNTAAFSCKTLTFAKSQLFDIKLQICPKNTNCLPKLQPFYCKIKMFS